MGSTSPVPSQLQIARIAQKPSALAPPPRFAMESASLAAKNGALRLPPGFRFHPTDEELVVQYLARKAHSHPLPASIIPDIDLTRYNPWDLPGGSSEERYFFTLREPKYPNGSRRANRAAAAGFWKATGKDKEVLGCNRAAVVGMKKVLVFYQGKPAAAARTDWVMHEYRLAGDRTAHNTGGPTRDWVLCRIFKKKRATNMDTEAAGNHNDDARVQNGVPYIDFMRRGNADVRPSLSASSSSESSCVTEHSKECCIGGEETSSSGIKSSA